MTSKFREGDIVCHKSSFLRSTCWYTGVPVNGRVVAVDHDNPPMLTVDWSDGNKGRILAANVCLYEERHKEPA